MSTFGKKALVWWDYDNKDDLVRFNNTPKDIQLSILEKWYPIGLTCRVRSNLYGKWGIGGIIYIIDGYIPTLAGYRIILRSTDEHIKSPPGFDQNKHPMRLELTDDCKQRIKRNSKLDRLIGGTSHDI